MPIPPGLSIAGGSDSPSTTVLSTPTSQEPPSIMISILPFKSCITCCAVVGDGFVDAFADGAAKGRSASLMSNSANLEEGMRTPKLESPAVTSGASVDPGVVGSNIVKGPGQNLYIRG